MIEKKKNQSKVFTDLDRDGLPILTAMGEMIR